MSVAHGKVLDRCASSSIRICSGTADFIASGDKRNLLRLGSYQGIQIVTARVAIESLSSDAASLKT